VKLRAALAAASLVVLTAAPATAQAASGHLAVKSHRGCTRTSSGSCIRGGEFCKQSEYRESGWDAVGRRYVCKGSRSHPHWEIP